MEETDKDIIKEYYEDGVSPEHEQVVIFINKKYNDFRHDLNIVVDKYMAPIVKALYEKGLATMWSCEGTWDPVWNDEDEILVGGYMYVTFEKPLPWKAQKMLPRIFEYEETFNEDGGMYGVYIRQLSMQGYLREKRFDILLNWVKELPDYNVWNKL